ncbi:hypothetical protein B566_EDAN017684 [Ephemera danica]|nr:hypothetical protein B566_EDAN017684 [Ephemera danica]
MPGKARQLINVYVAKSMKELNDKVSVSSITLSKAPVERLARSATKLLENAEDYDQKGDEEKAYICYIRYLHVATHIQKTSGKSLKQFFNMSPLGVIISKAETLSTSLKKRYELIKMAQEADQNSKRAPESDSLRPFSPANDASAVSIINGTSPAAPPVALPQYENKVTCLELYDLINRYRGTRGLLIMDIRSAKHYEESHLDAPCIINVPEDIIESGKTTSRLEKSLSPAAIHLWKERGSAEYVVLMDWFSKLTDVIACTKLYTLRNILQKWDVKIVYKRNPVILEGGYEDWLTAYPFLTTNANVSVPRANNALNEIMLDDIDYPTWSEHSPPKPASTPMIPSVDRGLKPPTSASAPPKLTVENVVPAISQEPEVVVVNEVVKDEVTSQQRPLIVSSVPSVPTIDRTTKQLFIEKMERDKQTATDAVNLLQKQKADKEKEMELLRMNAMAEADKEMFKVKEVELLNEIDRLQRHCQEQEEEKRQLQQKLDEAKQAEEHQSPQRPKSSPANSSIASTATVDNTPKPAVIPKAPKPISAPASGPKSTISSTTVNLPGGRTNTTPVKPSTAGGLDLKFEALKIDGPSSGGGLTRSHSSPNINNMDDTMPFFDRGNKPAARRTNNEHYGHRQRDFSPVYGSKGRGLTGLKNLGNSCYMNSIVQCISNTMPLNQYFCEGTYRDDVCAGTRTRGQIVEELAAVVRALWTGDYRAIACRDFKRRNIKPPPSPASHEQEKQNQNLEIAAAQAWSNFKHCNESHIQRLFYGQQSSTVRCQKCFYESVTFEPFSSLTLVLPGDVDKCSLADCLDMYLAPELVSEWKCPKCKNARPATKKFDIWRLPPTLVIHFKRFYEDVLWRKQHTTVDFPLSGLEMRHYSAMPHQRHTTYNLYAVSNHYGTMDGGHYTTYSRSHVNNKWYKFDDADVAEISESNVRSNAAYILFYASLNCPVPRQMHSAS